MAFEKQIIHKKPSILITGASTGKGKATAHYFVARDWLVFATIRNPEDFYSHGNPNLVCLQLDVTKKEQIKSCFQEVYKQVNDLTAIVNNAGFGGFGAFEISTEQQARQMFDVNVFGSMNVTREVLPHFRKKMAGTVVYVSSIGGRMTYPLFSLYHSTKWAIEGFSESLYYELRKFGIRVKLIEPGATSTYFSNRSLEIYGNGETEAYDKYSKHLQQKAEETFANALEPESVAKKIFEAATDGKDKLRYPVGNRRSMTIFWLRKLLPGKYFRKLIIRSLEK